MAFSLTQSKVASGGIAADKTITFDSTPAAGSLLLCSALNATGTNSPTCSDGTNSWTLLGSSTRGASSMGSHLFGFIATPSQPTTVTLSRGSDVLTGALYEFAGGPYTLTNALNPTTPGSANAGSATTSSGSQPSITTTKPTLVFTTLGAIQSTDGWSLSDGTFTAGQTFQTTSSFADYWKAGAAATYNPSFSWAGSSAWCQLTVGIRQSVGSGLLGIF